MVTYSFITRQKDMEKRKGWSEQKRRMLQNQEKMKIILGDGNTNLSFLLKHEVICNFTIYSYSPVLQKIVVSFPLSILLVLKAMVGVFGLSAVNEQ